MGNERQTNGAEITCTGLVDVLKQGKTELTQDQWDACDITSFYMDNFVVVAQSEGGTEYFQPSERTTPCDSVGYWIAAAVALIVAITLYAIGVGLDKRRTKPFEVKLTKPIEVKL